MPFVSVKLDGAETLINLFDRLPRGQFMRGVGNAVTQTANDIMKRSKAEVPLEDGILRGSATVKPVEIAGNYFSITMGYGGAATAYALIQHENLSFHHPGLHSKRRGGGGGRKAKYLEDPVNEAGPAIQAKIAAYTLSYFLNGGA